MFFKKLHECSFKYGHKRLKILQASTVFNWIQKWKFLWCSTFVSEASKRGLTWVIPPYNSHLSDFPKRWLLSPTTAEMIFYPHWPIRLKTDSSVASGPSLSFNFIILLFSSYSWILLTSKVPSNPLPLVTFPLSTPADWHSMCVCVCVCLYVSVVCVSESLSFHLPRIPASFIAA